MAGNQDSTLVKRIKQRDSEALAGYIEQHRGQLAGFLRSITGDHLLAVVELDDLLQEVSATALTSLDSAPLDNYEPMQWLQQIARRRVVDAHRFHFEAKRRDAGRTRRPAVGVDPAFGQACVDIRRPAKRDDLCPVNQFARHRRGDIDRRDDRVNGKRRVNGGAFAIT